MKRISIFCTYDAEGIIDRYISYCLSELRNNSDTVIVVCNMEEIIKGKEYLSKYSDHIYYRKNVGMDAGAFKDAMVNLIGWEELSAYDEIVLMNDSLYGPFIDMKLIFDEMDGKDLDFWGLLKCASFVEHKIKYQEHIHSFFLAFRRGLFESDIFKNYWEKMPYYTNYSETVINYETYLTQYFVSNGYVCDVYSDTQANVFENGLENYPQCSWIPYELIVKRKFPFLKRHVFRMQPFELLENGSLGQINRTLKYISDETGYDVDLILENAIRTQNAKKLITDLNLIYFTDKSDAMLKTGTIIILSGGLSNEFVSELKIFDGCINYFSVGNFGDIKTLLFEDTEYIGFVGYLDLKTANDDIRKRITKAEIERIKENMLLGAPDQFFNQNRRLGLLVIPNAHYDIKGNNGVPQLTAFWIRKEFIHILWEKTIYDVDKLMNIIRKEGFYTALIESRDYAAAELCEEQVRDKNSVLKVIEDLSFLKENTDRLYVYGTGNIADSFHELFYGVDGYVVSDGRLVNKKFYGKRVFHFSELCNSVKIGIYVCLSKNNVAEVKPFLDNRPNIMVRYVNTV